MSLRPQRTSDCLVCIHDGPATTQITILYNRHTHPDYSDILPYYQSPGSHHWRVRPTISKALISVMRTRGGTTTFGTLYFARTERPDNQQLPLVSLVETSSVLSTTIYPTPISMILLVPQHPNSTVVEWDLRCTVPTAVRREYLYFCYVCRCMCPLTVYISS